MTNPTRTLLLQRERKGRKCIDRKISWKSYRLDEIELVHEKAEQEPAIGNLPEKLEVLALTEAHDHCGLLKSEKGPLTTEQFEAMNELDKETVLVLRSPSSTGLKNWMDRSACGVQRRRWNSRCPLGGRKGLLKWEIC